MNDPTHWHTAFDHDLPPADGTIRTVTGRYVNLLNPDPDTIALVDIAHALSLINRFGGHTAQPYSVAEHCLGVEGMLWRSCGDPALSLVGLLHDAAEAYLGDMVRPLKNHMAGYRDAENHMQQVIFDKFVPSLAGDLPAILTVLDRVKEADNEILAFEMSTIRNSGWRAVPDPQMVRAAFIDRYNTLAGGAGA